MNIATLKNVTQIKPSNRINVKIIFSIDPIELNIHRDTRYYQEQIYNCYNSVRQVMKERVAAQASVINFTNKCRKLLFFFLMNHRIVSSRSLIHNRSTQRHSCILKQFLIGWQIILFPQYATCRVSDLSPQKYHQHMQIKENPQKYNSNQLHKYRSIGVEQEVIQINKNYKIILFYSKKAMLKPTNMNCLLVLVHKGIIDGHYQYDATMQVGKRTRFIENNHTIDMESLEIIQRQNYIFTSYNRDSGGERGNKSIQYKRI